LQTSSTTSLTYSLTPSPSLLPKSNMGFLGELISDFTHSKQSGQQQGGQQSSGGSQGPPPVSPPWYAEWDGFLSTNRPVNVPLHTQDQASHNSKAAMEPPSRVTDTVKADTAIRAPTTKALTIRPTAATSSKSKRRRRAAMDGSTPLLVWLV
jgi:hypothetical protein